MSAGPHPIPIEAQDDRLGFVGTSGSGKTYCSGTAVERILARGHRVIITDPLGVWWGLRLRADGKKPSSHKVVIFGGQHGDLPITEHAGALVGEAVANASESCIVDLSGLGTKAAERRFMLAFLSALYRKASGEPVHIIFDEADMWAPQMLRDKDGDAARLLGMMETVVRRGRIKGFVPWLITQRPASISKDVLSQIDGLVAFKLTSSQDRDAIGDWVKGSADLAQWKSLWAELPTKPLGEGVIWLPSRGILNNARFPAKDTFDSSRTPKRGERLETVKLLPIDIGRLSEKLKTVEQEAKANDPAALRAEISRLQRQVAAGEASATAAPSADQALLLEQQGYARGRIEGYYASLTDIGAVLEPVRDELSRLIGAQDSLEQAFQRLDQWRRNPPLPTTGGAPPAPARPQRPAPEARRIAVEAAGNPVQQRLNAQRMDGPEIRVLQVLVARHPARFTRAQWATLAGMSRKGGTWIKYVSRLKACGYIDEVDGRVIATPEGHAAAGPVDRPPAGSVVEQWKAALGQGPARMIDALLHSYPNPISRRELATIAGMTASGGTFIRYLSLLRSNGLIEVDRGGIRAASILTE